MSTAERTAADRTVDAVLRLTAWLRDYGSDKQQPFVDDVAALLDAAKRTPEWKLANKRPQTENEHAAERYYMTDAEVIDGLLQVLCEAATEIENLGGSNIVAQRLGWTIRSVRDRQEWKKSQAATGERT